ncbi:MFS transporter, partial [Pseudoalteromonas sp. S979]
IGFGKVLTLRCYFLGIKAVGRLSGFSGMAAILCAVGLSSLLRILTWDVNITPEVLIGASLAFIAMAAVWIL